MKKHLLCISMAVTFIAATIMPAPAYALSGGTCVGKDYVKDLGNGNTITYYDVKQCGGKAETGVPPIGT